MNDQPTDQPTTPALVSLEDAAAELGITVNAVRQRIKRGTLIGIRTEAGWLVNMVATILTNQPASATDHQPTIDLAPLVSHIATLEDQVQRLTEASTMWQIRARQAEEQLKALTAGATPPGTAQEAPGSTETNERPPTGVMAWLRRLL
jgi:hypothetical protein